MSLAQHHHNQYWLDEHEISFSDYERNWYLPELFTKPEIVLDVGCGDGAVSQFLQDQKQITSIGLDFSHTALTKAQQRGVKGVVSNVDTHFPIKSSSIDTVFFGDVIEHIYHPHVAIEEIYRVLKPKGRVIISCPNMGYWRYRLTYLFTGMFPETEWIEPDLWNSQHIRFFNKKLMYELLRKYNFTPTKFIGVSRRRLDKPLLQVLPELFGMIMLVEAVKHD